MSHERLVAGETHKIITRALKPPVFGTFYVFILKLGDFSVLISLVIDTSKTYKLGRSRRFSSCLWKKDT